MKFVTALGLATTLSLSLTMPASAENSKAPYPEGYRNWTHIKSMLIQPGHALANPFQGIHHVYANKGAVKGLKTGRYANGSVLVFDLLNYTEQDKTIQEADRKLVGIMHRDGNKFASTGGWGFEGFGGDSKTQRLVSDGGSSCFGCHVPQKESDYVFSKYRQ